MISPYSRFRHGIMLFLLLAGALAAIISLHNYSLKVGADMPLSVIIFVLLTIICGVVLYRQIIITRKKAKNISSQLEQLKASIEQCKEEEKKKAELAKKEAEVVVINLEAEVQSIIPTESFNNKTAFTEQLLSNIAKKFDITQGIMFLKELESNKFTFLAGYAYFSEEEPREFIEGETLSGQVAKNKVVLNLNNIPDNYITILSGLGKGSPNHLMIIPVINSANECLGIIELASFVAFEKNDVEILRLLGLSLNEFLDNFTQASKE